MNEEIKLYQSSNAIKAKDIKDYLLDITLNDETVCAETLVKSYVHLSRIQEGIEQLKKDEIFKKRIISCVETMLGGAKDTTIMGAVVSVEATKTTYDYSKCGHTEYDFIMKVMAYLDTRKKAIEEELKGIAAGTIVPMVNVAEGIEVTPKIIGGTKDVVIDNITLQYLEMILETSKYTPGEVITVRRPTVERSIGVKVNKK